MFIRTLFYTVLVLSLLNPLFAINYSELKTLPLVHEGRLMPFDTFTRKFAYNLTGKENPFQKNSIAFTMELLASEDPFSSKVLRVDHLEMKKDLALSENEKFFSYKDAIRNGAIDNLGNEYNRKRENKIPLTPKDEAYIHLATQLNMLNELVQGESFTFYPMTDDLKSNWISVEKLHGSQDGDEKAMDEAFHQFMHGNTAQDQTAFDEGIRKMKSIVFKRFTKDANLQKKFKNELTYNSAKPFRITYMFYILALLASLFFTLTKKPVSSMLCTALMAVGFIVHTWGLWLRTIILERPPVSNMYESVVFVGWCIILFFLLVRGKNKNQILINSTLIAATLIMIMADLLPMSSELGMLEAVLRSNYWLTIHVLVIVASYGAFALSTGLSHYYIIQTFRGYCESDPDQRTVTHFNYKVLQWGTILLGAGTILGGVWANESWGRFWGWDPKETWALISFLGYMALLHGRKANWFHGFGMAVGSVIGFLLILMTWYGVNFVLGTGLHSYGFGSGGTHYAIGFTLFEILFLMIVWMKKNTLKPA